MEIIVDKKYYYAAVFFQYWKDETRIVKIVDSQLQ